MVGIGGIQGRALEALMRPVEQDGQKVRFFDPELHPPIDGTKAEPSVETKGFGDLMTEGLEEVSRLGNDVKNKLSDIASGGDTEIHEVLAAMGKSEVAFKLMLSIRNRLVDAWKEISRLQV